MQIKDYVRIFDKSFEKIKSEYREDFDNLFKRDQEWLGNVEDKIHLLKNNNDEQIIEGVINKLKSSVNFTEDDTKSLSIFIRKINGIILIANRINNFKEGTILEDGSKLKLFELFNSKKTPPN